MVSTDLINNTYIINYFFATHISFYENVDCIQLDFSCCFDYIKNGNDYQPIEVKEKLFGRSSDLQKKVFDFAK